MIRKKSINFETLLNYRVFIETSICWQRKDDFLKIIDDFVGGEINAESFEDKFLTLHNEVNKKSNIYQSLIENSVISSTTDFEIYFTSKACDFSRIISLTLFTFVELYSSDITDQESSIYGLSGNELKRHVKDDICPSLEKYRNTKLKFVRNT